MKTYIFLVLLVASNIGTSQTISPLKSNQPFTKEAAMKWLNERINEASKAPVDIDDNNTIGTVTGSGFTDCEYIEYSDTWIFDGPKSAGSIDHKKVAAKLANLETFSIRQYLKDGMVMFYVLTINNKRNIPVFECKEDKTVTSLLYFDKAVHIGPFVNNKEIVKEVLGVLQLLIFTCQGGK